MARKANNGRLEESLQALQQATLTVAMANFLAHAAETYRELAELKRTTDARFGRIEAILLEHSRILAEHSRILQALPDAIRDKIGFKAPSN